MKGDRPYLNRSVETLGYCPLIPSGILENGMPPALIVTAFMVDSLEHLTIHLCREITNIHRLQAGVTV